MGRNRSSLHVMLLLAEGNDPYPVSEPLNTTSQGGPAGLSARGLQPCWSLFSLGFHPTAQACKCLLRGSEEAAHFFSTFKHKMCSLNHNHRRRQLLLPR